MNHGSSKTFVAMMSLINGLRVDVLQAGELVLAGEPNRFARFRSQILRLFGRTRGVEKQLVEFFEQNQNKNNVGSPQKGTE